MALELYPTTVDPLIGYLVEPIYYTQRTPTKSGADVAEKLWDTPRFRIRMQYRVSTPDATTILNFHHARRGSHEEFDFIDLHARPWTDVYVGTGDGSTRDFDCDVPTSGCAVLVDGVVQTPVTDYTFGSGTGDNGRDQILFTVGGTPPDGDVITVNGATGTRYYVVRFENDSLPYRTLPQFTDGVERLEFQVVLISQR